MSARPLPLLTAPAQVRVATMPRGLFTSLTCEWGTPDVVFEALDAEFHFTLDVCAREGNARCARFHDAASQDALSLPWEGVCWCNPPYGREIGRWVAKAHRSAREGATVVCLLPSRTDTGWWHDYVLQAEVRFIRGRLHFLNGEHTGRGHNAPFPSAVVIFRPAPVGLEMPA